MIAGGGWGVGSAVRARNPDGKSLIPPPGMVGGVQGPFVWDANSARRIPSVSRCLQLYGGMSKQMRIDAVRGLQTLDQPPLLARPDPTRARSWFVQNSVEDYLLNGNAISVVTVRGGDGWPRAVMWIPASWVFITWTPFDENSVTYWAMGQRLPYDDVIHVRRGADRMFPVRGVGVVEEQLDTLDRVAMEEEYERSMLAGSAVPSVVLITPSAVLTQDVADDAKASWMEKFGGPVREPAVVPNGTQVVPLSWSPSDAQLVEARRMSLLDVANMFNLDGYWLGAPTAGITYKTAAPQYQQILRTSIEPVLADFEDVWSYAWLPRGQRIRFDRQQLLREDLPTATLALVQLVAAGIITPADAAMYLNLPTATGEPLAANTLEDPTPAELAPGDPAGNNGGGSQP